MYLRQFSGMVSGMGQALFRKMGRRKQPVAQPNQVCRDRVCVAMVQASGGDSVFGSTRE
jgi:hypothetical protein